MKILLYIPPSGRYMREVRCQAPLNKVMIDCSRTPLSLAYIAAVLGNRHICKIIDYPASSMRRAEFKNDINNFKPDMIVAHLTMFSCDEDFESYAIAKSINNNIKTVAFGGISSDMVLLMKKDTPLDIYICQEPEEAFGAIAENKPLDKIKGIIYKEGGKVIDNSCAVCVDDLDSLPYPRRDLLNNALYIRPDIKKMQTEIETGRGCGGQCIFCMTPLAHGKKIRMRSSANILGEIEECINRFGIKNIFFRADNFTWNKRWVIDLCSQIASRRLPIQWCCNSRVDTIDADMIYWMKRAGCWLISFGIEHGNQDMLDKLHKGFTLDQCRKAVKLCKESGIKTYLNFIIGLPWDNKDTIRQTINFSRELDADFVEFPLSVPFPGTELYSIAKKEGLISAGKNIPAQFPLPTLYLSSEQVFCMWREAVLSYYIWPKYIYKTLNNAVREGTIVNYLSFGIKKMLTIFFQRNPSLSRKIYESNINKS